MFARINRGVRQVLDLVARERLELRQSLDRVAEEFDAQRIFPIRRANLHRVPAHAEVAALERDVVARVLEIDEAREELVARQFHVHVQRNDQRLVILLAANAVNTGNTGDHHHIAPREQRNHGGQAHPLDGVVDAGVLFNKSVGARDVGFWLVIIKITDKIFDRIFREKRFEFGVKLCGQRFVVRDDEGGLVDVLDDVGDRERLARAGHAQQCLVPGAGAKLLRQLGNGLRLIARGLEWRDEFKHECAT